MYLLIKDFNQNGIKIAKGEYTKEQLIFFFGSEDKFNFCFNCTNLKEVLTNKKELKVKDIIQEEVIEEEVVEEEVVDSSEKEINIEEEVVEQKEIKQKTTKELKNQRNKKDK